MWVVDCVLGRERMLEDLYRHTDRYKHTDIQQGHLIAHTVTQRRISAMTAREKVSIVVKNGRV